MCGDVYLTFWSQLMPPSTSRICIIVLISLTAQHHIVNCIRIRAKDFLLILRQSPKVTPGLLAGSVRRDRKIGSVTVESPSLTL